MKLETIGNATLTIFENEAPILSSDIWFEENPAYFGSWSLSHKIPKKQRENIERAKFIFISHFHPDHLNIASLKNCKKSIILIAQHYGSRVESDLRRAGFNVINLPSRKWISISKSIRIMLFSNELQDSAMLVEITDNIGEKTLILNLNDSAAYGFEREIISISKQYKNTFYLSLHGYGDADMINIFDFNGNKIEPLAALKFPVGKGIKSAMKKFKANVAIPFSSFHQYQRRDSFWANDYTTDIEDYKEEFKEEKNSILLPPFQEVYFKNGSFKNISINPEDNKINFPINENEFGDNWHEILTQKQVELCKDYFESIKKLKYNFSKITVTVGGIKNKVLSNGKGKASIDFNVPKNSLIRSIKNEIFDDLLIGNFMKTTLYKTKDLYSPDFTYTVGKYSDNGGVKTNSELKEYFAFYNNQRITEDKINMRLNSLAKKIYAKLDNKLKQRVKYLVKRN